jgi:prepilin-type processing-associated H-X9-DG protein
MDAATPTQAKQCPFNAPVAALNQSGPYYYDAIVPLGNNPNARAREHQVPYATCPSDGADDRWGGWSGANYTGSLGSQRTTSANSSCNIFDTPGVNWENPQGNASHGNASSSANLSGMFTRTGLADITFAEVRDGTANTIFVGEIIAGAECHDHGGGWWYFNGPGSAHASTAAPINTNNTCIFEKNKAYPSCTAQNNWNLSWGFRSYHPGGAQFLFVDGSAHFLSETIDYATWQHLGGRKDGFTVGQF